MPEFEVELDRVATGGQALGVGPDGRIVFVTGGLPGERVVARPTKEHKRRIEAELVEVTQAHPARRPAPCAAVADGCGGCDWQHVHPEHQSTLRQLIVVDCLRRLAGIEEPPVEIGPTLPPTGYRTTVRAGVVAGRAGYRRRRSHDLLPVDACLIAHPGVEELLVDGRFGAATEVVLRIGARTGERLVLASPTAEGVVVPDDVVVVGADEVDRGHPGHHHEEILGRRLRISARSFFQCRPDGAEALVRLVDEALGPVEGPVIDAYGGVGLFGALLGRGRPVIGVEAAASSAADAAVNYDDGAVVHRQRVEDWTPQPAAAVIADPARSGLGKLGVERLAATDAGVFVLVSCDPGALARDAGLLLAAGYRLTGVTTVDLFAQTSHVEAVSRFERA
ncbi:MAG: class I SAM-dependent RNA methyltransferase [Actinomycetota bacterium]